MVERLGSIVLSGLALSAVLLSAGCASRSSLERQEALFIAADMTARSARPWQPVRDGRDRVWHAAHASGCLALLSDDGRRSRNWLPGFRFRGHYILEDDTRRAFRVAALHRHPERSECGPLWTYEYCTFRVDRELSERFWGISGPRICLPGVAGASDRGPAPALGSEAD